MDEYNTEKYIEQYEHISKLQLLTNAELSQVKKKRAQFEVSVKNAIDPKPFIEHIKYELALIKKLQHLEFQNENDERALERAMSRNVKDIFSLALRKFQDRRKLWSLYIAFAKSKFSNTVSGLYQQMLNFHSSKEDYIEAIEYEISKSNFNVALSLIIQAMGKEKDSKEFIVLHIKCSLMQADEQEDEKFKENTIQQATNFYTRFLKDSADVLMLVDLLTFAMNFQNQIISNILAKFSYRAEIWDLMAKRHLNGFFYGDTETSEDEETRLKHALAIYKKSFEIIDQSNVKQMYDLYITELLNLDEKFENSIQLRSALGEAMNDALNSNHLSEIHTIYFIKLRIFQDIKDKDEIEKIFDKSLQIYPKSMELNELAVRYFVEMKNFDKIAKLLGQVDEKNAIELYKCFCEIYPGNSDEKLKVLSEIVKRNDKSFQPYIIEFYEQVEGIKKARDFYSSLLKSKNAASLSLDFFKMMIKLEQRQKQPDLKIIANCFERAIDAFGKDDPDIWIEYVKHLWSQKKFVEANGIRKRAMEMMKKDIRKINEFEVKFTLLRNESEDDEIL